MLLPAVWRCCFLLLTLLNLHSATSASSFTNSAVSTPIDTVVLIVVDDLGFGDLGYTGSGIATPTIDGLAQEGTVLDQYHVYRACSPTRAALLTSRYVTRYGFQSGVLKPEKPYGLSLNETLLPQRLAALTATRGLTNDASDEYHDQPEQPEQHWQSHAIGKWHVGYCKYAYTPTFRGFQSFFGYYNGGEDYYTHVAYDGGIDLHEENQPNCGANCSRTAWEMVGQYSTHIFTRRAQDIINAVKQDDKLFVYLAYQGVHCPAQGKLPSEFAK